MRYYYLCLHRDNLGNVDKAMVLSNKEHLAEQINGDRGWEVHIVAPAERVVA